MNVLITGGAGFIGSHLTDLLIANGNQVTIIDNLSTGFIKNVHHLKQNTNFKYYIEDMMNERLLAECIDDADWVFHLAAAVGVNLIVEDPIRTIRTNIQCTEKILEHCAKKKKRLLITSTSEVYGKNNKPIFNEEDDLVFGSTSKSRWSYATSKAIDEFLALAYHKTSKQPITIVRLFNTVGPRQTGQYGMVIPSMITSGIINKKIKVFGDGTQSRCFCHVFDVVQAMLALMKTSEAIGQVYNLGSQEEITIENLAIKIKSKLQALDFKNIEIQKIPYQEAYETGFEDMQRRMPDLQKIKSLIQFQPTKSLDKILDDVIQEKIAQIKPI